MKLLFLYPSTGKSYLATNARGTNAFLPPLGLLYLAKMVELQGHSVEIIDFNAEQFTETMLQRAIRSADAIGMTVYSQSEEFKNSTLLAKKIKQFSPDIPRGWTLPLFGARKEPRFRLKSDPFQML